MCSDKKDSYQRLRVLRSVKAGISVTDILSRTVSELSQNIVPILDTLRFWATLWGLMDNVPCSSWAHWKAHSGLAISVNWTFFDRCYGWGATGENRLKIGNFAPTRSVWPKISGRRGRPPPIIFAPIVRQQMLYNFIADSFHTKKLCSRLSSSEVRLTVV